MNDYYMREQLKAEIDRMSHQQICNLTRSQNGFIYWCKQFAIRVWNIVIDSTIVKAGVALFNAIKSVFF